MLSSRRDEAKHSKDRISTPESSRRCSSCASGSHKDKSCKDCQGKKSGPKRPDKPVESSKSSKSSKSPNRANSYHINISVLPGLQGVHPSRQYSAPSPSLSQSPMQAASPSYTGIPPTMSVSRGRHVSVPTSPHQDNRYIAYPSGPSPSSSFRLYPRPSPTDANMHSPRPHTKHKCIKEMLNEQGYSASSSRGDVHDICKCYKCQATHYAKKCKELKKAEEEEAEKEKEQEANKHGINIEEVVKSLPKKIYDTIISTFVFVEASNMWNKFGKSFLGRG